VPRPWYRTSWFSWLVVVGIIVVILAVLVLPVAAQDSVAYCTSCKAMEPAERTWSDAAHSEVSCVECHVPEGTIAGARWRLTETRNIWADYLGMAAGDDVRQLPTNASCLKCHPVSSIPDEQDGVRMNHAEHLEDRGLLCYDCHTTTSHKRAGQSDSVSMATCAMCHNDQGAPAACDYCHTEPENAHAVDFMKDHGEQARINEDQCLRCHHDRKAFCDTCHGYPSPNHFSGTWRYTHAADAAADPESCDACHDERYCSQCHAVQHPSDWEQAHGEVAGKSPEACLVCHPQSMCDECHQQNGVTTP
jgi:hypothetical protein